MKAKLSAIAIGFSVLGCSPSTESVENGAANEVTTSGKSEVSVADVPQDVIAAVKEAEPQFSIANAEAETRDGRRYFDIGGTGADGSEMEFDVMEENGRWRIVETQRDIAFSSAPEAVRDAVRTRDAALVPSRVIESTQQDGLVIYEVYGPVAGDAQGQKVEVRWDGREASLLTEEWAH